MYLLVNIWSDFTKCTVQRWDSKNGVCCVSGTSVSQLAVKVSVCWNWCFEVNISRSCKALRSLTHRSDVLRFLKWKQHYPNSFSRVYYIEHEQSKQTSAVQHRQVGLSCRFVLYNRLVSKIFRPSGSCYVTRWNIQLQPNKQAISAVTQLTA